MEYNFDEIIPREGTSSIKWDSAPTDGVLPMWVADMDFKAAPAILKVLQKGCCMASLDIRKPLKRFTGLLSTGGAKGTA